MEIKKMTKKDVLWYAETTGRKVKVCGYCELYKYGFSTYDERITKIGYNCGIYGWNYDVLLINNLVVVTGYRPFEYERLSSKDFD